MDTHIRVLTLDGSGNLVAGTAGSGVWFRPLSDMITSVNEQDRMLPRGYSLDQNYPNPFNPTTAITFSVATYSHTSLKVYDILGREVATLVNEQKPAGTYTQKWNAENFPSGVYFYRLQAGSFTETKKLVLLK
jgi:hypothetical protein